VIDYSYLYIFFFWGLYNYLKIDIEKDKPEKSEHHLRDKEDCETHCPVAAITGAQAIVMMQ
jgi:hypothetical protein